MSSLGAGAARVSILGSCSFYRLRVSRISTIFFFRSCFSMLSARCSTAFLYCSSSCNLLRNCDASALSVAKLWLNCLHTSFFLLRAECCCSSWRYSLASLCFSSDSLWRLCS